ncbi:MAG: NAD(P)/FAD-dependent oxidoreductase [Novosphingobium sp.]|nr:NAD(P)/FAD-dependent oxidoreductase [Novosphingobium sp.]MCB2078081.1 NAD(P)/FAD-dependent oxidoreductase [Novosphingobium sp.]MCP5400947.1 NAD(P)/FAD-dependent oxidoreductase [Novosphingobium sp.]
MRDGLLAATDDVIEDAVRYADPMVLRGLLYQLTGDEEILSIRAAPLGEAGAYTAAGGIQVVPGESDVRRLQAKAVSFLKATRDAGAVNVDLGPSERLFDSLALTAGEEIPDAEREMWMEQTALDPWVRGVSWKKPPPKAEREEFLVGIIGAGLSGLAAAVHLKRAGIPYVVLEKNDEVGGTWYENRYPGARVDSPSRSYTHLFGVSFPYPYNFCPRDENMKYMRWVADNFDLRENISFETEVSSVIWNEAERVWDVAADTPSGDRTWKFNAVISCVGFLSRPNMPEIEGMESFEGSSCHTAQWLEDFDVTGKRIAVIGSGASGYQTTPELAKLAEHIYLFQRTPSWCFENPMYVTPLPEQSLWLDRNFPYYVNFARFRLSWLYGPRNVEASARVDPNFSDPHAASEANKASRDARVAYIREKLAGRPDLIEKMIPPAPPMSSRPIMIDTEDSIYEALMRDNVTLVTKGIEKITPAGIVSDGEEIPVDVIVYATGFKANDFLWPMEIRGRDGVRVEELWAKDGARAYIGSMLPGFPNFFMAYGPNTNNFGGFQIIDLLEIEIRFALHCIAGLIERQKRAVDVTTDAYWRFNEELDRNEQRMIYMDPRVNNYYRNEYGRSAVNGPLDFRRMWNWLRDPTRPAPNETDAGLRPYFGEDLVVI